MPCTECGGALTLENENGGINGGPFTEIYECVNCGARGSITGESSDPPNQWRKQGQVFEAKL